MARKFLTPIDLSKLEIQNVALQNLASDPTTPATGQIYYNTGGSLKFYNGSAWQTLGTTAGGATLTISTGLTGTSYNGSTGVTIAIDTSVVATLTGTQTLTNKSIGGAGLTFNGSTSGTTVFKAAATAGTTTVTLPATTGTVITDGDTGTVTNTMLAGSIQNVKLVNSSITIGTTSISLGASSTTLAGLTSVSSTGFTGALTGNASTATTLQTARTINGTSFDGSANITVTAAAGTLTGTTLNSTVVSSSLTSVGSLNGLTIASTQTVSMGSNRITNVADPTSAQDAATKAYVDGVAQGINAHDAVQYATTANLAWTYAAGTTGADGGTGVGATLTNPSTGVVAIDSSTNLALNDRVLVKNQTTQTQNGIYYVTTAPAVGVAGVLTRALDADNSVAGDITAGDLVYVLASTGSTQGGTQWVQTATGTATTPNKGIKIGTDNIVFSQFSGASSTTAGAGLVANGNAFDVGTASTARIVVNADNIDLATVSQSNTTTSTSATSFVSAHTVDSYGRVTGTVSGAVPFTAMLTTTSTATATAAAATNNVTFARKAIGVGIGSGTSMVVNHGLGQWVHAQLFDSSTGALVEADVVNSSANSGTTTFTFASSQTLTGFQYVIVG